MYPSAMVVAATPRMACSGRAVGTSFYLPCVYRRVVGFDRDPSRYLTLGGQCHPNSVWRPRPVVKQSLCALRRSETEECTDRIA